MTDLKKTEINQFNIHVRVEQLAGQVSTFPSGTQKYHLLSTQLDDTLIALTQLKTKTFASEQLENRIVELYGELENKLVERELSQIKEEASSLQGGRISKKAILQLERHIKKLKENHLTLSKDRQIIQMAEETLLRAKRQRTQAATRKRDPDPSFQLRSSAKEASFFCEEINPTEIYDLLEIARLLHDGHSAQAKRQFALLPEAHRELFQKLMGHFPATAFEDPLPTIQALIATANRLAKNGEGYPSPSEIDDYFSEITRTLPSTNKIIPIDFN